LLGQDYIEHSEHWLRSLGESFRDDLDNSLWNGRLADR